MTQIKHIKILNNLLLIFFNFLQILNIELILYSESFNDLLGWCDGFSLLYEYWVTFYFLDVVGCEVWRQLRGFLGLFSCLCLFWCLVVRRDSSGNICSFIVYEDFCWRWVWQLHLLFWLNILVQLFITFILLLLPKSLFSLLFRWQISLLYIHGLPLLLARTGLLIDYLHLFFVVFLLLHIFYRIFLSIWFRHMNWGFLNRCNFLAHFIYLLGCILNKFLNALKFLILRLRF